MPPRSPGGLSNTREAARGRSLQHRFVGVGKGASPVHILRHPVARNAAIDGGVGDAVAAEPVGAVDAARVLARGVEAGQGRGGVGLEGDAAHHVMRRRHHLDQPAGEVEAAVPAALDHALEALLDRSGTEMGHGDVEPAAFGDIAGAHLARHGAADDIAGGALQAGVVALHEPLAVAAEQVAAGAAQALFQHRAGHAGAGAGIEPGRVKLHHLHVAQCARPASSAIAMPSQVLSPEGVW